MKKRKLFASFFGVQGLIKGSIGFRIYSGKLFWALGFISGFRVYRGKFFGGGFRV